MSEASNEVKEKNYEFMYKQHTVESQVTKANPLLGQYKDSDDEDGGNNQNIADEGSENSGLEDNLEGGEGDEDMDPDLNQPDEFGDGGDGLGDNIDDDFEDDVDDPLASGIGKKGKKKRELTKEEIALEKKKRKYDKYKKRRKKEIKELESKKFKGKIEEDFGEEIKVTNREAAIGAKKTSKRNKFLNKLLKNKKEEREDDEGGLQDVNTNAIITDDTGYLFKGKWKYFIKNFQDMYDIDILAEFSDRPFDCIGFGKRMNEKIKNITEASSTTIGKPDNSNVKQMKLKDISGSIGRRQKKITYYWKKGQKKNALHIAYRLAEIMGVVRDLSHYPVVYSETLRVVEIFGRYVKSRFKRLIFDKYHGQRTRAVRDRDFLGAKMLDSVREIAENWVTFCGNVPDLTSRVYISICLIFLHALKGESEMQKEVKRIIYMLNCQMNPVVYAFAGCYMIYQVQKYPLKKHKFMVDLLMNFLPKITIDEYTRQEKYLSPFINFCFDYIGAYCKESTKKAIFEQSSEVDNGGLVFCKVIEIMPQEELQVKFKKIVVEFLSMKPEIKIAIYPEFLRLMSRVTLKDKEIAKFVRLIPEITSFEKYVESLPHFLNIFGNHSNRVTKKHLIMKTFEHLNNEMNSNISSHERFSKLDKLFKKMIDSKTDLTELLTFEPFLNLLHYPKKKTKMNMLLGVLDGINQSEIKTLKDPILAYTILELTKTLTNDKLFQKNNLDLEKLQESFSEFVRKVDFGKNVEESLNFITKVRSHLSNRFKPMNETLIYKALNLVEKSMKWSKGKPNRKLRDFIQACSAFAYISLMDLSSKKMIQVSMHAAQITMQANLAALTDSIIHKLLEHIEKRVDKYYNKYSWKAKLTLTDIYKSLITQLLTLPDNPESDHFLSVFKLLEILEKDHDIEGENILLILDIYNHIIHFLAIQHQDDFPYRIPYVKSNDQLYKGQEFKNVILDKMMTTFESFYLHLQKIKEDTIEGKEEETVHILLRIISTLANYFVMKKGVINKMLKDSLNIVGRNIKEVKKKKKKVLVKALRATVTDCYLAQNPKIGKLANNICSFFSKKKKG